jgi:hypothetical protein
MDRLVRQFARLRAEAGTGVHPQLAR